ncbi:TPA: hypothetical protein MHU03_01295 [Klebsiella pneumoniae]|nr:hypothetical protein [Klebsiella pneumoniae]
MMALFQSVILLLCILILKYIIWIVRGKSLITEDGEAIEGEALDDVTVAGVVTHIICDVRSDSLAI